MSCSMLDLSICGKDGTAMHGRGFKFLLPKFAVTECGGCRHHEEMCGSHTLVGYTPSLWFELARPPRDGRLRDVSGTLAHKEPGRLHVHVQYVGRPSSLRQGF
jgi:hypothetical protein